MRKTIFVIFCLISFFESKAQISSLPVKNIQTSFNKTTHLIFPTDIKYFTGVEELVILKQPVSNVLSIKANVRDFGKSNLNVATADGKFYAFNLTYIEDNTQTNYFIENDSTGSEIKAEVNFNNLLHIVLPNAVKYIDFGNDWIEARPIDKIQNIVRVETFDKNEDNTNISVIDEKNNFYTFDISYNDLASNFNIVVGEPKQTAILAKEDLTDNSKEYILEKLKNHKRKIQNLGVKRNSIIFSIENIFVADNKLVFRFNFKNTSNVKYDIDYMKFYIIDKKQTKESALQEVEYIPLFLDNFKSTILGKEENSYSVCFEKFTIPDKKFFIIEVNEKEGGRHVYFKINNRAIENAQAL